jgi:hypothetical protein
MNNTLEDTLARLAAAELDRCMLKMTKVSPGAWQLGAVRAFTGTVREALSRKEYEAPHGAVIRVKIKGDPPFTTALLYNPDETKHISGCFADESFYGPFSADQPEVTVIEIGNIVLNALANALLRAFVKTAVPSVPAYFKGSPAAIEEWLGAGRTVLTVVSAKFTMKREGRTASGELIAFLPAALAAEANPKK